MARLFWIAFAASTAVYVTMGVWTAPVLKQAAAGQLMLDMRPLGYSYAEVVDYLTVLDGTGRDFYLDVQHKLDLLYPALLAAAFVSGFCWLFSGWLRWGLIAVALVGAFCDYSENVHVGRLLRTGPDGITPEMVATASLYTQVKSGAVTVCFTVLLVMALRWGWRRLRT